MKNLKPLFVLVFWLIYYFFFWKEKLALNLVLFDFLLLFSLVYFYYRAKLKNPYLKLSIFLTLLSGFMVIFQFSIISRVGHILAMLITLSLLRFSNSESILDALFFSARNFIATIFKGTKYVFEANAAIIQRNAKLSNGLQYFKLIFIPAIIFIVFVLLYSQSNPIFETFLGDFYTKFIELFDALFLDISLAKILYLGFGFYLIYSIFYNWLRNTPDFYFFKTEEKLRKQEEDFPQNDAKIISMIIISLNALLLIINAIDINFLWLNFSYATAGNLSQLVHEGTFTLILSIILSMSILLFAFRGQLNFYAHKKPLQILAYCWIIQNVILLVSVCIRNSYYIGFYGLTYKRIGVYVFLFLLLLGMLTLFLKIKNRKTFYNWLKLNSWAFNIVIVLLTIPSWDGIIFNYNVKFDKLDAHFLFDLTDRALVDMDKYFRQNATSQNHISLLESKIKNFQEEQRNVGWLSWNWSDYKTQQYLNKLPK